jgi:hypothetical protein
LRTEDLGDVTIIMVRMRAEGRGGERKEDAEEARKNVYV